MLDYHSTGLDVRVWMVACGCLSLALGPIAEAGDDASIRVTIAVPSRDGRRSITLYRPESHFHVVIRNTAPNAVRLWRDWCSWGYRNLRFEWIDAKGETRTLRRKPVEFRKNHPDWCELEPGTGVMVLDVNFDPKLWDGPPLPEKGGSLTVRMRAVYEVGKTEEATREGVWTGEVSSEFQEFTIYR